VLCGAFSREVGQTWSFRGSKSRNKVSVGEPAEGSLTILLGASPINLCESGQLLISAFDFLGTEGKGNCRKTFSLFINVV
jgi:hypothetical protein